MIIGVTGTFGSGKSLVVKYLGKDVINVDKIGHQILEKKKKDIVKIFGKDIIRNKKVDRKKLGNIVFSDKIKLNKLNKIVHPEMVKSVKEKAKGNYVIDAALLVQLNLDKLCDKIILVKSNKKIQTERLLNKGYSKTHINNVISEQNKQFKKLKPDLIIRNVKTKEELKKQVKQWIKKQQLN
jgi:dephospho-CoA kinase